MRLLFKLLLLLAGLVMVVKAVSSQRNKGKLNLGDSIPVVTAEDQDGHQVDLASVGNSGYTLVYFYPKAMTPGLHRPGLQPERRLFRSAK